MDLGFYPGSWFWVHIMHEWLYHCVSGGGVLAGGDAATIWAVDGSGVNFG